MQTPDRAVGAPDVQRLIGAKGHEELALFVTLGGYSSDARASERTTSSLRLLSGEDVVDLVLRYYATLGGRWRSRIPLTPVLVVDDAADAS